MRGILMVAHNNELFDYGKMAYASALAAAHYINEPVCLITDERTWDSLIRDFPDAETFFLTPIFIEPNDKENERRFDMADGTRTRAKYHNLTRLQAYDLTPFSETLLIDSDVLVQDAALRGVWGSHSAMRMNQRTSNLIKTSEYEPYRLSENSLTAYWATICYFRKCPLMDEFFAMVEYVAQNYEYYGVLYGFSSGIIRVDFIFTIAAHILSGYVNNASSVIESLPNDDTLFAWSRDVMINVTPGSATFMVDQKGTGFPVTTYRTVHCMNKDSMQNMTDRIISYYA